MAEFGGNQPGPTMAFMDTGRGVPSPHGPQPLGQDAEVLEILHGQRQQAEGRLEAHQAELHEQMNYHEQEIARAKRVIAACSAAIAELETKPTMTQPRSDFQTRAMREPPGFA